MEQLYLPVLSHFQNGNAWTASDGRLRCRIVPGEGGLTAEAWEGPWAYEFSRVEDTSRFPMDETGLEALRAWAARWGAEINARPPRTLEENLRRRDEVVQEKAKEMENAES